MAYQNNAGYSTGNQTRSVITDGNGGRTMTQEFICKESGKVTTNKVQLTCVPNGEYTDKQNPYKIMNQGSCSLQIILMPYQGNTGGAQSKFNISWPQADLVTEVARNAMIFKLSSWDLADRWSKTNELERVFGEPLPPSEIMKKFPGKFQTQQEATGYCRARILVLRRTTVRPDGQEQRLPWYIQIQNGYARKIMVGNGGACMERKSFLQETECHTNVADGDMYSMFYWNRESISAIMSAGKPSVARAHVDILKSRKEWIARQNSNYSN